MESTKRKLRPFQRDTKEDELAKKQRSAIVDRFPHREDFEKDLKSDICDGRTLCVKSVKYLESFQSRDPDRFWLDLSRSNYLTMLYYVSDPPKLEEATRQNEKTLKMAPRNFNALWSRSEIYLKQKKYSEVKESLRMMADLLEDSVQMMIAKAELGVSYPDFGPALYQKSIGLLEEVLQDLSSIPDEEQSKDLLGSRAVKWKFDLIHTYNRLMNKGTIQTYWEDSTQSSPKHEALFRRIKELFEEVAASGDLQYTAEAWIELGDACKKYEEKVPENQRTERLPDGKTVNDCFEMALKLGPDDVFVLERCGRHYRQRATDIYDFKQAIELLKRCIALDPYRDVAYHHLGLAYRSMWLETDNHEEARLHTNTTKRFGTKRSIQKKQQQKNKASQSSGGRQTSSDQKAPETKASLTYTASDPEKGSNYSSVPAYARSASDTCGSPSHRNRNPDGAAAHQQQSASVPATPTSFNDTIPPKYPKKESEVPKHYRKPDYYDRLRSGNPLVKDPRHKYILEESRNCFQKASYIRQGTSCRYLVDLARTFISTGDLKKAWDLFVQAGSSDCNSNDRAYLYEQWGLMAEVKMQEETEENVNEHRDIEEVKNFYREAIRCSVESMERSRMAFYRLRDIIYQQMQDNPSDILEKEHLLLYTTIQDAKKAQEILENMNSDQNIVLMWELVDLFHARNRPEDSEAAFQYLALLADAKKLREPVEAEQNLERIMQVIQISERNIRRTGKAQDTLSKAFDWLITLSDGELPSDKKSKDASKVCILAPSSDTPGVDRVMHILTDVVGVEILQGFVEDSPDLRLGRPILEEIENLVRSVRTVIVVMQQMDGEKMSPDESQMKHILQPFVSHPDFATKRFCRAVSNESKKIECNSLMNTHPVWNLDETDGKEDSELDASIQLAFRLLRALFSGQRR